MEDERTFALQTGLQLVSAHPLLGVGYGNYTAEAEKLHGPLTPDEHVLVTSAHNLFVTVWAEPGVVGVALLLLAHLTLARALWRRYRAGSAAAAGGLLALIGYHGLGLFHYPPHHTGVQLTFVFVWALCLAEPPEWLTCSPHRTDGK